MELKALGPLIEKASPILGAIIGGPAGGIIASLVASVFGGDPTNPDDLAKRIAEDPDADFKLKQLEIQHKDTLAILLAKKEIAKVEEEKNNLDDIQRAREFNENHRNYMSWLFSTLMFVFLLFIGIDLFCLWSFPNHATHEILLIILVFLMRGLEILINKNLNYNFGGTD